ncbi:TetR/AcrR family transcriptional regulator [Epilithonimonas mollis]|uniref:Transcriptional regulator, TetR family n=1 Tax=Epilithonimonas mollis TaxID=216903 RepID=A0A1M6S6J3_9FLAO|nr:TetR/AcrR family transcriptional regulator [Epilithonimonas mollis]SHK40316.1 transcriptional regulator, TetR family [Epilithonimonas mollis]
MSNLNKDQTQELIKETAKTLFFREGKFNATTQEIADAAGVNRTLINYYFRSRDKLFNSIFEDAIKKEEEQRELVLMSTLPFKEKIEKYIDDSIRMGQEYPYLETYIVSRINDGCFYKEEDDWHRFMDLFHKEFREEVKKGNVEDVEPIQFILNLASLVSFPLAVRPLFQTTMKINDEDYDKIISERKEVILNLLFKN